MPITIGRIENKFWNNSDAIFPNSLPIYKESKILERDDPNMIDFLSGTIYLYGDQWNHCQYKDAYYSLQIYQVLDENKKYYLYRLERDLWMDVLKNRPVVHGSLVNSNNDKLLEKNLNRTIAVIDNPARVITINFKEDESFNWSNNFIFRESDKELKQIVLSKKDFDSFIASAHTTFTNRWKDIDKRLFSGDKNPAVFILAALPPSITTNGWKHKLRKKINKFVREISGDDLKIGKVTEPAGSKIVGSYCITQKQDGISSSTENYRLLEIDLSGLEDIIPLNPETLKETVPNALLYKSNKSGLFNVVDTKSKYPYPLFAKVRRRIRTPINAPADKRPPDGDSWGFSNSEWNWTRQWAPQVINWEHNGKEGRGLLWWIDNLNFFIEWDKKGEGTYYTVGGEIVKPFYFPVKKSFFGTWKSWGDTYKEWRDGNTFRHPPIPWTEGQPFPHVTKNFVPFGLQIFGLSRPFNYWKLFEYISNTPAENVQYFSGLRSKFIYDYNKEGKWWSRLTNNIKKIQPSEEFVKFYLDNFYFAWVAFFPGSKPYYYPYYYTDLWGTWKYTNNNYYASGVITSDIYDIDGKLAERNPFNDSDERFISYRNKVDKNLSDYFLTSTVELPEGLRLTKGDYLFNWKEYEIWKCPLTEENQNSKFSYVIDNLYTGMPSIYRLEDVIPGYYSEKIFNDVDERSVVLCTSLDGNIEIRTLYNFERNLSLADSGDQILKDADGLTQEKRLFTLLKKYSEPLTAVEQEQWTIKEDDKPKIIKAFYDLHGYKTGTDQPLWTWFNDEDFEEGNEEKLFFDLVGTQWYCFIHKGKISLISKSNDLFVPQTGKSTVLDHSENKDLEISLIEKINQKVRFQFLGAPYYLNWKTTFTDKDNIFMSYESIKPSDVTTPFEEWFLKIETEYDQVYYENVSVPKEVARSIKMDGIALDQLRLQEIRNQYSYQIDQDRLKLATDRFNESMKRAQTELDIQRSESYANVATTIAGMGLAAAGTALTGGLSAASGVGSLITAGAITGAAMKVTNMGQSIFFKERRFSETQRRISVDKHLGARDLALQSLVIDTSHMDRQISTQMNINKLCNTYANPMINDRLVLKDYMDKDNWHGKKLKAAHLMVFIPSEEQVKALKGFKKDFGVMCDIPDVKMRFFDGMDADIIRFRDIEDSSLNKIHFEIVRRFFKARLLAGIKIIKTSEDTYELLTPHEFQEQIFRLNKELIQQKGEISAKEAKVIELTNKVTTIAQDTRKECAAEKTELERQIQNIENQLNEVNRQLREKIEELKNFKDQCKQEKDALETEREQWRETETNLNNAIRRIEGQKTALEEALRKVTDERDASKISIRNLTKQVEDLEEDKNMFIAENDRLTRELDECKQKPSYSQTDRDRITALQNKDYF